MSTPPAPVVSPSQSREDLLRELAVKYIWWQTAKESLAYPLRIAAQVMNIGDYDDVQKLARLFGDDFLRSVIAHAEIGQFSERSWHYWHYRLGLAQLGSVPEMPVRKLA